jgi:ADP-heptose:LPS heptosyltransferase/polysaccharide pyruvyl transferase WcaK-like protein
MLKIGFLTTVGVNVGDEFIRNGIRAVLDRVCDYTPLYVNKHDPASIVRSREDESLCVADKFFESDLFIQAGAPVYWNLPSGASSVTSEWYKWMWQDRLFATDESNGPVFVNLGAGSCQPWADGPDAFLKNEACARFAAAACARARLTTVRDSVAKVILDRLDCHAEALPCPAFLAAMRWTVVRPRPGVIGVNLMPIGSHYDFEGDFPTEAWQAGARRLVEGLRKQGTLWFIAHDAREIEFLTELARPGERVFWSASWRDYLDAYGACSMVVANRVHGAVTASGFGVPAVIIGNDTRAQIGDFIGIKRFRSGYDSAEDILEYSSELIDRAAEERDRLLELRSSTLTRHEDLLRPVIDEARAARTKRHPRAGRPGISGDDSLESGLGGRAGLAWRKPQSGEIVAEPAGDQRPVRIVFSKTDALGDQLWATGTVAALLERQPGANVIWLVRDGYECVHSLLGGSHVFRADTDKAPAEEAARLVSAPVRTDGGAIWSRVTFVPVPLNGYAPYSADESGAAVSWWIEFAQSLQVDCAIAGTVAINWVDRAIVFASAAPQRIGYDSAKFQPVPAEVLQLLRGRELPVDFTDTFSPPGADEHEAECLAKLLEPVIGGVEVPLIRLEPLEEKAGAPAVERPIVLIAPGAGDPKRIYPIERLAFAIEQLAAGEGLEGVEFVILQGPRDAENCQLLKTELRSRSVDARVIEPDPGDLRDACRWMEAARLLICNETFWVHLASAAGTPTVAIWGLGHWEKFLPKQGHVTVLHTDMLCRQCDWHCCFTSRHCVTSIPAEEIVTAARERLEKPGSKGHRRCTASPITSADISAALRRQVAELVNARQAADLVVHRRDVQIQSLQENLNRARANTQSFRERYLEEQKRVEAATKLYWEERQKLLRHRLREVVFGRKD